MKPAARIAAFKSRSARNRRRHWRNSKKALIRLFDLAGGCAAALTLDGIKKGRGANPQATFWTAPLAGWRRLHPCLTTLGASAAIRSKTTKMGCAPSYITRKTVMLANGPFAPQLSMMPPALSGIR
jgi:hypothetical protein